MVIFGKPSFPIEFRFVQVAVLCVFAAFAPATAQATHETMEPSDGTVSSFRQLNPPREPPFFEFLDSRAQTLSLADFRGKIVLLNLWATWCAPCVREMPALDGLQGRIGKEDFLVIPISLDRKGRPVVESFYRRLGLRHLDIYLDPEVGIADAFPVDVLPANFLVDRQGRVTAFLRSYVDWEAPEAEAMIRRLVGTREDVQ